jgi:hypothetical protein
LHLIHSHNSGLQAIQRYRLSTLFTDHRYTSTRVLNLFSGKVATDFMRVSLSLQITYEVFNSCHFFSITFEYLLHISTQFSAKITQNDLLCPFVTHRHGPRRKHSLSTVEACLVIGYLATDVHCCARKLPWEYVYHCLPMILYVIYY